MTLHLIQGRIRNCQTLDSVITRPRRHLSPPTWTCHHTTTISITTPPSTILAKPFFPPIALFVYCSFVLVLWLVLSACIWLKVSRVPNNHSLTPPCIPRCVCESVVSGPSLLVLVLYMYVRTQWFLAIAFHEIKCLPITRKRVQHQPLTVIYQHAWLSSFTPNLCIS